jgi:hypothetical protein
MYICMYVYIVCLFKSMRRTCAKIRTNSSAHTGALYSERIPYVGTPTPTHLQHAQQDEHTQIVV